MKKGDKKLKGKYFVASRFVKSASVFNSKMSFKKGGVFSGIFSSKGERADQALECYKAAATKFKLANSCKKLILVEC